MTASSRACGRSSRQLKSATPHGTSTPTVQRCLIRWFKNGGTTDTTPWPRQWPPVPSSANYPGPRHHQGRTRFETAVVFYGKGARPVSPTAGDFWLDWSSTREGKILGMLTGVRGRALPKRTGTSHMAQPRFGWFLEQIKKGVPRNGPTTLRRRPKVVPILPTVFLPIFLSPLPTSPTTFFFFFSCLFFPPSIRMK